MEIKVENDAFFALWLARTAKIEYEREGAGMSFRGGRRSWLARGIGFSLGCWHEADSSLRPPADPVVSGLPASIRRAEFGS